MEEIWKDIKGYEGEYQVSNFGRVKSLSRILIRSSGYKQHIKERILKPGKTNGYLTVSLNRVSLYVHRLVAITFIYNPYNLREVNHLNLNRADNHVENLEWVSTRDNTLHAHSKKRSEIKYPGASWSSKKKKWAASIFINGKSKCIGIFNTEKEANIAYQNTLISNGIESKYAKVY